MRRSFVLSMRKANHEKNEYWFCFFYLQEEFVQGINMLSLWVIIKIPFYECFFLCNLLEKALGDVQVKYSFDGSNFLFFSFLFFIFYFLHCFFVWFRGIEYVHLLFLLVHTIVVMISESCRSRWSYFTLDILFSVSIVHYSIYDNHDNANPVVFCSWFIYVLFSPSKIYWYAVGYIGLSFVQKFVELYKYYYGKNSFGRFKESSSAFICFEFLLFVSSFFRFFRWRTTVERFTLRQSIEELPWLTPLWVNDLKSIDKNDSLVFLSFFLLIDILLVIHSIQLSTCFMLLFLLFTIRQCPWYLLFLIFYGHQMRKQLY
jgi:hypothetical protein